MSHESRSKVDIGNKIQGLLLLLGGAVFTADTQAYGKHVSPEVLGGVEGIATEAAFIAGAAYLFIRGASYMTGGPTVPWQRDRLHDKRR